MEKRRASRYKKRISIKFGAQTPNLLGFIEDISFSGLRIKTNHVFKPGTVLKLEITHRETIMCAEGLVTWARKVPQQLMRTTRCGMGVTFLKIDNNLVHYFEQENIA